MLLALTNDMLDAGVDVHSPLEPSIAAWIQRRTRSDHRGTWSPVPFDNQRSIDEVASHWIDSAAGCDAAIVIAPELDGILEEIIVRLRREGIVVLAGDTPFLGTACDQWKTCEAWRTANVRHPETNLLGDFLRSHPEQFEGSNWLVKRRDSAGCVGMRRFENRDRFEWEAMQSWALDLPQDRWVVQPWVPGTAASLAVLVGDEVRVLGAFEQRLEPSIEGSETVWGYYGGTGPIPGVTQSSLETFAQRVLQAIPGKPSGWIGIDFIIEPDGQWCAVEINPRLTTSYLGYRQWYGHLLASCWTRGNSPPQELQEFPRVFFSVDGFEG